MVAVTVGTPDVNSEDGVLLAWHLADGAAVRAGDVLAEVETSKAIVDVVAATGGVLRHARAAGERVAFEDPIAYVFADAAAAASWSPAAAPARATPPTAGAVAATDRAVARASELGVDLATVAAPGLVTVADVEAAAGLASIAAPAVLPEPLAAPAGAQRVLLLGAGLGATQVLDIFAAAGGRQMAIGILDDDRSRWGAQVEGVPVLGGRDRLGALHAAGAFDAALCVISKPGPRTSFRRACVQHGVPLANAVDPSARIGRGAQLGVGNVLCAFTHLGTGARIGDGNFLSANTSLDHHCTMGDDCATGPGCMASGLVRFGDRVRLGTGVFVEPELELGDDVQVASGAVLLRSVPAGHAVKTTVVTTRVVGPASTG